MLKTDRLVIVEGKYDKIKLEKIVDAMIITTDGFAIFKDKQKTDFIKKQAQKNGVLILTDSDAAGFKIRNYLSSFISPEYIKNAYIPDIEGKDKRKARPSGEGKLGVEGIDSEILLQSLKNADIEGKTSVAENHTTYYDLYNCGLFGKQNSKLKRALFTKKIGLPERISKNNLLKYINSNLSKEEFENTVKIIMEETDV